MTGPEQPDPAVEAAAERAKAAEQSRADDPEATEPGDARSNPPEHTHRAGGQSER